MTYNKIFVLSSSLILLLCGISFAQQAPYQNPNLAVEVRVQDLLQRMTMEEKVAQLQCELVSIIKDKNDIGENGIGGFAYTRSSKEKDVKQETEFLNTWQKWAIESSRWGIPAIIHAEALHGLATKKATIFPQAIALASTWNTEMMLKVSRAIATETKARGVRQVLSPVVNIARDVRWGRTQETYGEDPFLISQMGVAFCKSFEDMGVVTSPKHFVANVGDGGRDSYAIYFNERLLRDIYFPGFKACIQKAGSRSIMAAYNSLDGIPAVASSWLLNDILRKDWDFKGFVVSDYNAIDKLDKQHLVASTREEAAKLSLEAGMDRELPVRKYYDQPLLDGLKEGRISLEALDEAVANVLRVKFEIGLFENPYGDPQKAAEVCDSDEHRAIALESARESIVLLKNDDNVLPFSKNIKKLAILGPVAKTARMGDYSGYGVKTVSILEGIKNHSAKTTQIFYEPVFEMVETKLPIIGAENFSTIFEGKEVPGVKCEYFNNTEFDGEPVLTNLNERYFFSWANKSPGPNVPENNFSARFTSKLTAAKSGNIRMNIVTNDRNRFRFYVDGKRILDCWDENAKRSDNQTFFVEMKKGQVYDFRLDYVQFFTGGASLSMQWEMPAKWEEQIDDAMKNIQDSDAIIFVASNNEKEGMDRADLRLEYPQEDLIHEIAKLNKPFVVVLVNGTAVTMRSWLDKTPAILETWYTGEEGGNAVAEVIYGETNPSGKLPISFPIDVGQLPLFYNNLPSGRGYDYAGMSGKAQFPFGFGLSYTTFEYSNIRLEKSTIPTNESAKLLVDVTNTGSVKGDEVVQMYINDEFASVVRPLKELKGFERISLEPNQTKTIEFIISPELLSMWDKNMKWVVEPGKFDIMIGSSSEDIRQQIYLTVSK